MNRKGSIPVIHTEKKVRIISLPKESKIKHKLREHLSRALLNINSKAKEFTTVKM